MQIIVDLFGGVAKFSYLCSDEDTNMGYLKYKGYTGSVEYSEDDKCLFGKVQGMAKGNITYEGATPILRYSL